MKLIALFYLAFIFSSLTTCDISNYTPGPCDVRYGEPILNVSSVKNTISKTEIEKVYIYELRINGDAVTISSLEFGQYLNIEFEDTVMICSVPFGFGSKPGTYEFLASIPGQGLKSFKFLNVDYSDCKGGCPLICNGGYEIELEW